MSWASDGNGISEKLSGKRLFFQRRCNLQRTQLTGCAGEGLAPGISITYKNISFFRCFVNVVFLFMVAGGVLEGSTQPVRPK
ncbi:hypothetical protein Cpha266_1361 [Chlorobium phaeobacteroides DSM 266]|uniref:Uncharacterized protein n=1 Tax=Chlorobium phaeobacteroides (strain DSM 266 / SMG 266 / 2430) TaxID=290317 RepID=A1BG65_CHLPD|nr:hypothetical protein Cpha266_1361 [Chlorobium phaeobacteroides DSM 266]